MLAPRLHFVELILPSILYLRKAGNPGKHAIDDRPTFLFLQVAAADLIR